MQPFSFIPPTDKFSVEHNLRDLDNKTTFKVWTPTLSGVGGSVTTSKAYAHLVGGLCYYWIEFTGSNLVYAGPGTSKILGAPYGPNSSSGLKSSYDTQYLHYYDGVDLSIVTIIFSAAGVPQIILNAFPTANRSLIQVWGTFYRD